MITFILGRWTSILGEVMEVLTEDDWLRFDEMVDSAEPWSFSEIPTSIVFRGESVSYTIDFVRKPYVDSLKIRDMLEQDGNLFADSGFQTILPLAKSVEMHMRLLFLGGNPDDFQNTSFQLSKCCRAISSGNSEFIGMNKNQVLAKGEYWSRFSKSDRRRNRLVNLAYKIYDAGNPYRHNRVRTWTEVRPLFDKNLERFEEFMKLFDKLVK